MNLSDRISGSGSVGLELGGQAQVSCSLLWVGGGARAVGRGRISESLLWVGEELGEL